MTWLTLPRQGDDMGNTTLASALEKAHKTVSKTQPLVQSQKLLCALGDEDKTLDNATHSGRV